MNEKLINQFLSKEGVQDIIRIFTKENVEICFVGGCIRDVLSGIQGHDIDFAINCVPEETIKVLNKNNIEFDDYGKKYGSILAIINSKKFEITSLREDINQKGRDTDVKFTNDWYEDALRRDFTMNAIYLFPSGILYDYFDGQGDIANKQIRFIGDIEKRITEDFLRIFRYYRFLGIFEKPQIIDNYELMLHRYCNDAFNNLSNDIIRMEILKMFNNPFALNSFCNQLNPQEKNYWLKLTTKYFLDNNYKLGLEKCLNKVDILFQQHQDNYDQ